MGLTKFTKDQAEALQAIESEANALPAIGTRGANAASCSYPDVGYTVNVNPVVVDGADYYYDVSSYLDDNTRITEEQKIIWSYASFTSPEDLDPIIWVDPSNTYLTMAAAPNIQNGTFATDTNWTKGTNWTIGGGTANHTSYASATAIEQSASVINGCRYKVTFDLVSRTGGSVAVRFGSTQGTLRSIPDTYSEENFTNDAKLGLIAPAAPNSLAGSCDNFIAEQLTVTTITPRISAGGTWTQTTTSQKPWKTTISTKNALRSDKTKNIFMTYTGNVSDFNSLHNGVGSWWAVFNLVEITGIVPGGNLTGQSHHGIYPYINSDGSIRIVVGNGGSNYCVDATSSIGIFTTNTTYILIQRWEYPENYEVYLGGTKIIDTGYIDTPSSSDASYVFDFFTSIGQTTIDSSIRLLNFGIMNRKLTDTELNVLGLWLKNNVGGSWT